MLSEEPFPFKDQYLEIAFAIVKLDEGNEKVLQYNRKDIKCVTKFRYQKLAT